MPKTAIKFSATHQKAFPFLQVAAESESEVLCMLCQCKFSIANGGRRQIKQHIQTQKHIKATKTVSGNQSTASFLDSIRAVNLLRGKEQTADTTMEIDELIDFQSDDNIRNCRLCFRPFTDPKKSVEITEKIQQKFFDLTQFQLIQDESFSNMICILCSSDLESFSKYRYDWLQGNREKKALLFLFTSSSILERQKKLYETRLKPADNHLEDLQEVHVKEEPVDDFETGVLFIECKEFVSSGEKTSKVFEETAAKKEKQIEFESRIIQCPKCNKSLNRDSLKEHSCSVDRQTRPLMDHKSQHKTKLTDKGVIKGKKRCSRCGKAVKDLRRHNLQVHLKVKKFFCDICPYGAFVKYDLANHMKAHIKEPEVEKYVCDMCGSQFKKRSYLTAHMKAKHTITGRILQCTVCKKIFSDAKAFRSHAESHEPRNKPCEFCGKLFTCKRNLRSHLYLHSEPKFVCDFPNCDKKFFMKRSHRDHLKTHRGQKDFVCQICQKSFYLQSDVNRHTIAIHEKLRFYCQVPGCDGNFSRRAYYKKHALAHHLNLRTDYLEKLLQDIKVTMPSQKC